MCLKCLRERPGEALSFAMEAQTRCRRAFGLPEVPPKDPDGIPCNICVNECRMPEGGVGYYCLRKNEGGEVAFHPHFYMSDMSLTTRTQAEGCLEAARGEGLRNVRIGNIHLLV
ncbi:MAG: hypothetical protein HY878_01415 [Deltaproteobacteria bacterium]|nr:hypothetical protein [Deltaproteobacteria bacterium]